MHSVSPRQDGLASSDLISNSGTAGNHDEEVTVEDLLYDAQVSLFALSTMLRSPSAEVHTLKGLGTFVMLKSPSLISPFPFALL